MARRKPDKTTLLPKALLEKIVEQDVPTHSRKKQISRRERRDLAKQEKKQRKTEYFAHKSGLKRPHESAEMDNSSPPPKRPKLAGQVVKSSMNGASKSISISKEEHLVKSQLPKQAQAETERKKTTKTQKQNRKVEKENLTPNLNVPSGMEIDEDNEIAWLEYQLGLTGPKAKGKKSGYQKILEEEGLEDLFDGLESEKPEITPENLSEEQSEEDSEETDTEDSEEEAESDSYDGEAWKGVNIDIDATLEEDPKSDDAVELIASITPGGKYVPPHLRARVKQDDAKNSQLVKQIKGMINRLSEQNITTVLSEVEELYRNNPRNDVTSNVSSVLMDAITFDASLLDNHIAVNAALVSLLYRVIGIEFVAHFVQELVKRYEAALDESRAKASLGDETIGKQPSNLLVCIAHLYNFEVISCILIYDIVKSLLQASMGELEVELLLKILRISGKQLRQDDPLALKDIVQMATEKTSGRTQQLSSRTRFMLETLTNLKNNRIKKADASTADATERLKKLGQNLSKRHQGNREPLRMSLEDLRSADTRGKWWVVGAGWAGDPLAEQKKVTQNTLPESTIMGDSQRLRELARKQGMNTDIRQSIFVILMSSEDYIDACEKLTHMNLNEQQQREIIRVLIRCCSHEKSYNPYYSLIGQHLCGQAYSYKITAQYCLWDFMREEVSNQTQANGKSNCQTHNVARLYAWWIAKGSVSLSVLKALEFGNLDLQTRSFLDTLFLEVFVNSQVNVPVLSASSRASVWSQQKHERKSIEEVMLKAARHEHLSQGLLLYFTRFGARCFPAMESKEGQFFSWALQTATNALESGVSLAQQQL